MWFKIFLSNTSNLQTIIWFQVINNYQRAEKAVDHEDNSDNNYSMLGTVCQGLGKETGRIENQRKNLDHSIDEIS